MILLKYMQARKKYLKKGAEIVSNGIIKVAHRKKRNGLLFLIFDRTMRRN